MPDILDLYPHLVSPEPNSGCWLWAGATVPGVYGCVRVKGRTTRAHRYSWFLTQGELGDLQVLHKCDVRLCVNPDHLFLGTQQDNVDDMISKNRYVAGHAKLTMEEVNQIRVSGGNQYVIAAVYNITQSQVSRIRNGKRWRLK